MAKPIVFSPGQIQYLAVQDGQCASSEGLPDGFCFDEFGTIRDVASWTPYKSLDELPTITSTGGAPVPEILIPNQPPINNSGFSCPTPGGQDCLARIQRDDITVVSQVIQKQPGVESIGIDLEDARGMQLCTMCGMLLITKDTEFSVPPAEVEEFTQALFFYGTWSLTFRGKPVPGFSQRPLTDITAEPGCCDSKCVFMGCTVPERGAMRLELDTSAMGYPDWVDSVALAVRTHFSGCGCPGDANGCGCGCGARRKKQRPGEY